MSGFVHIARVAVPRRCLLACRKAMLQAGSYGAEAFALWVGISDGSLFRVTDTWIPQQTALQSHSGVCVTVSGEELHRINVQLYEHNLELIAQLHSHPTAAYHSETDDTFPIVSTLGAFSLVIPNFAREEISFDSIAAYRLQRTGEWAELSCDEVKAIFLVE